MSSTAETSFWLCKANDIWCFFSIALVAAERCLQVTQPLQILFFTQEEIEGLEKQILSLNQKKEDLLSGLKAALLKLHQHLQQEHPELEKEILPAGASEEVGMTERVVPERQVGENLGLWQPCDPHKLWKGECFFLPAVCASVQWPRKKHFQCGNIPPKIIHSWSKSPGCVSGHSPERLCPSYLRRCLGNSTAGGWGPPFEVSSYGRGLPLQTQKWGQHLSDLSPFQVSYQCSSFWNCWARDPGEWCRWKGTKIASYPDSWLHSLKGAQPGDCVSGWELEKEWTLQQMVGCVCSEHLPVLCLSAKEERVHVCPACCPRGTGRGFPEEWSKELACVVKFALNWNIWQKGNEVIKREKI